ncbi:MAG: ThuA domain-containing protein [Sphingopyxis sp.]|uniref:ThuA domain-containing protein n=1 Tax=Sphingopyxis sp. TaxID=1908224 RepID=UPI003D80F019
MVRIIALAALLLAPLAAAPQATPPSDSPPQSDAPPALPPLARPAVLIVSTTTGFRHDSIAEAVPAIERLAKARGWGSFATENAAIFHPAALAKFDVIVFANATGDFHTPARRAAFRAFLARGGGFVGLHSAGDDSHPDWFVTLRGNGRFTGHPGGGDQFQAADIRVADRTHPATRHLPTRWHWTDEYYSWDAPPAADAHVLARLDEAGMRIEPKLRMGGDHALIWWRCAGRARIFYSALGHRAEAWADPDHLKMVGGAIGWAARAEGAGCDA